MKFQEFSFFSVGFLIGSSVILIPFFFYVDHKSTTRLKLSQDFHSKEKFQEPYNDSLSKFLFDEVKVLCMVMTHPNNHRKKAIHVKNTWGQRCNKLIFISSERDILLDTVALPIEESRDGLWNKTKLGFQYLHDNFLDEFDWFMKADDDK